MFHKDPNQFMHHMGVVLLPDVLNEGETGAYLEQTKQRLVNMLLNYTASGNIIFDLQTLIRENIERTDVVAMIRDALLETETKCTGKVHLVWEHADDDHLDLLDHMWGADDYPPTSR